MDLLAFEKSIYNFVTLASNLNKFSVYFEEEIVEGMAKALWANAWADNEEEQGRAHNLSGNNIMDIMPDPPPNAYHKANELKESYERLNARSMDELYIAASMADDVAPNDPENFGHYLAMMALGTGSSWFDDHAKFDLKVPHIEYYYEQDPDDDVWNADDGGKEDKKLKNPSHPWHHKKFHRNMGKEEWEKYQQYLKSEKLTDSPSKVNYEVTRK